MTRRCAPESGLENHNVMPLTKGGASIWGGGDVDCGSVNAFLTTALTRVMRAAVSIPTVASASVLHSTAVGGSVVGVVKPL